MNAADRTWQQTKSQRYGRNARAGSLRFSQGGYLLHLSAGALSRLHCRCARSMAELQARMVVK